MMSPWNVLVPLALLLTTAQAAQSNGKQAINQRDDPRILVTM